MTAESFLGQARHGRTTGDLQQWAQRLWRAGTAPPVPARIGATGWRRALSRLVPAARTLPAQAGPPGDGAFPVGTDWVWRADPFARRGAVAGLAPVASGTEFATGVRLFHDCPLNEVGLRQRRNPAGPGLPPFGLELDIFGFAGSFLSLALDLPEAAAADLGPHQVLRLDLLPEVEGTPDLYARLNLRHGPETARMLRHVPPGPGARRVEFDLAEAGLGSAGVEAFWLDLILARPAMTRLCLRDAVLSRHPRARV